MTSQSKTRLALLLLAPLVLWAWMGRSDTPTFPADPRETAIQREDVPVETLEGSEATDSPLTSGPGRTPQSAVVRATQPPCVFGTVVDESSGMPIAGAQLSLFALGARAGERTITDRLGSFRFPATENSPTSFFLRASHEGYGSFTDSAVFASAEPLELTLAPELFLRGKVLSAPTGRPLRSFRVAAIRLPDPGVRGPLSLSPRMEAALPEDLTFAQDAEFANTDGDFELGGLREGTYALIVSAAGHAPVVFEGKRKKEKERPLVASPLDQAELHRIHLTRLTEQGMMYVNVLDAQTGRVIEAATVALESEHRGRLYSAIPSEPQREPDGRLRFDVPLDDRGRIDDVHLRVSATGYVSYATSFGGQENGWTLSVELGPGGRVHGTVLDDAGVALPHAAVFILGSSYQQLLSFVRTDAQGFYACDSLPGGLALTLYCLDPKLQSMIAQAPVLLEHGEDRTIDIGGSNDRGIFGRVTSMGNPVADASVVLYLRNGTTSDTSFSTEANGHYEFVGLVPGDYELTLYVQDSEIDFDEQRRLTYVAGTSVEENFEYTFHLTGILLDTSTGKPLEESDTLLMGVQPIGNARKSSRTTAYSSGSSKVLLPVGEPGIYEITLARGEGYSMPPTRVTIEEGSAPEAIELQLTPRTQLGEMSIRLFDKETGAVLTDGWCEYSSSNSHGTTSAYDGVILFDDLGAETVRYRLSADDHVPQRGEFEVQPGLGPQSFEAHLARSNAVRVTQVQVAGRASQAGLQIGDMIRRVGGNEVLEKRAVRRAFESLPRDQALELQVQRSGGLVTLSMRGGTLQMEFENFRMER